MNGKVLTMTVALLAVVAFAYGAADIPSNEVAIDCDTLPAGVQDYVNSQVSTLEDNQDEVELKNPPQALIEAIAKSKESGRAKRRTRVCRYVAIRNRRTRKTVVIVRCR